MSAIFYRFRRFWRDRFFSPAGEGAAAFGRLRSQLTLWYSAILAGMLILTGVLLYLEVQNVLLGPVQTQLSQQADAIKRNWQFHPDNPDGPYSSGPGGPPSYVLIINHQTYLVACYDSNGNLITIPFYSDSSPLLSTPFYKNPLFSQAIQQGNTSDTINGGSGLGTIYRYAEAVPDPSGNGYLGVVQIGELIGAQESALQSLLTTLIILGILSLLAATLGGFWLAGRALAPARLAFNRQQSFIADAAHELRTPLTLMRTNAEVLLRGRAHMNDDDASMLEDIVTEAGHLSGLATNLLTLARLDAGAAQIERDVVDLSALANRLAHRVHTLAQEKHVSLYVEAREPVLVIGDALLLEQAALILIDNAIKYNRQGGSVVLRTALAQGQASLEVRDTGIGIAPEHLAHLGERFYRVDKARSREAGGAGLGLSIARNIAADHQGAITFASIPGQGTTALLTLPAATTAHHAQSS
jgi:signal transduction histidine kinase